MEKQMNWTEENKGTLRSGYYGIIKLRIGESCVYMPVILRDSGWHHLRDGLSCDKASEAKQVCESHEAIAE